MEYLCTVNTVFYQSLLTGTWYTELSKEWLVKYSINSARGPNFFYICCRGQGRVFIFHYAAMEKVERQKLCVRWKVVCLENRKEPEESSARTATAKVYVCRFPWENLNTVCNCKPVRTVFVATLHAIYCNITNAVKCCEYLIKN